MRSLSFVQARHFRLGPSHRLPGNYQLVNRSDSKSRISTEKSCVYRLTLVQVVVKRLLGKVIAAAGSLRFLIESSAESLISRDQQAESDFARVLPGLRQDSKTRKI
jgi:hypothetical protein